MQIGWHYQALHLLVFMAERSSQTSHIPIEIGDRKWQAFAIKFERSEIWTLMDQIDRKILDHLQRDASMRNVDLADRVGLAPSSCLRRVRNLWKEGIITRSVVLTDGEKMGRNLKAIVSVKLVDHGNDACKDWLASLSKERSVSQVYSVSGETDAVVFLTLANMKEFQELSQNLFAGDPNVFQFVTQFVLEEHKFELAH